MKWTQKDKDDNIAIAEEMAQEGVNVARAGRQQGNLVLEEEGNRIIDKALEHRRIWQSR